ncbi:MAG: hypothetical protein Q8R34_01425 [bacterium]|nr:hypothetical protein [bacterium]
MFLFTKSDLTPLQVVESFYGAYRESEGEVFLDSLVTLRFSRDVSEKIRGGIEYAPITCGPDVGESYKVVEKSRLKDNATVTVVEKYRNPYETNSYAQQEITYNLKLIDGEWKINEVICPI